MSFPLIDLGEAGAFYFFSSETSSENKHEGISFIISKKRKSIFRINRICDKVYILRTEWRELLLFNYLNYFFPSGRFCSLHIFAIVYIECGWYKQTTSRPGIQLALFETTENNTDRDIQTN